MLNEKIDYTNEVHVDMNKSRAGEKTVSIYHGEVDLSCTKISTMMITGTQRTASTALILGM